MERKGFGIIEISEKLINTSLNYLSDDAEFAAFDTIDKVLKHGIEIEERSVHKNREHGTITFAAPVEINGIRGNVAVVVKETKGHRYKTHRILMPDGSAFVLNEKTEARTDWMTVNNDGESQSITSVITDNIPQNKDIVNTNNMQNSEKNSEGDMDELFQVREERDDIDKFSENDIITDKEQMFADDRNQLDSVVMQAQLKAKKKLGYLTKNGYAYTNDYFVMFENDDIGEYKMDFAIWVDGNEDLIDYLQEVWDNGRIERGTKNFNSIIADFRSGKGSGNRNNDFSQKRGTSGGDDRLSGRTQRSGPERYSGRNKPNSSRGDKIRYSDGDVSAVLDKAQSELEGLISEYGIIEHGETPARDVRLPKQTEELKK